MFILAAVSGAFVLTAIILTINRLLLERRFAVIQQEPDQTALFRRKVYYLRKIERGKDIRYLFFSSLATGIALLLVLATVAFPTIIL